MWWTTTSWFDERGQPGAGSSLGVGDRLGFRGDRRPNVAPLQSLDGVTLTTVVFAAFGAAAIGYFTICP